MGKNDDDDEKDAYSSNARSAGGGGKTSDDGDGDDSSLSPVLKAFCHHVVCDKFRRELDAFFEKHHGDFSGADAAAEQRLEWTMVFEKYQTMVETMLEDFCQIQQLPAQGVFSMVQRACQSGMLDDEFLPAILSVTEYRFFISQMGLRADEARHSAKAMALAQPQTEEGKGADSENLSGVWRTATKDKKGNPLTDVKGGLEKYLRALGVPGSLHNLFRASLFSKKGLVVMHDDSDITFVADTVTGRHKQVFALDGVSREFENLSGAKTPFSAAVDRGGRVEVKNLKPSGLAKGSAVVSTWFLLDGMLQCTVAVEKPSGVVSHDFYYARAPAKKGPPQPKGGHK
ncbi:hypothetical protein M885DRAFT_610268 [Pelagophyceae sp. CCMP2097]|nr:hypothetical protein M885DRAFT_610268 [Pelagophyceae sp. CCMP2097]|mmetsp:Transcript_26336/g.88527  ORF Transcript_26336/g.88527 Transcript_26336/m.88527 type:complete len:343 (-) Transcript_26336:152-1180(-)